MTPNNPFDERSQKVSETISFKKPKHASREEAPAGASEPKQDADWFEEDGSPIEEETPKKERASAKKKKQKSEDREEPPKQEKKERRERDSGRVNPFLDPDHTLNVLIIPIVLFLLFVFFTICFVMHLVGGEESLGATGVVGSAVTMAAMGLFGHGAFVILPALLFGAVRWRYDMGTHRILAKTLFALFLVLCASALFYTFGMPEADKGNIAAFFHLGVDGVGGGVLGSLLGFLLGLTGPIGSTIILIVAILFLLIGYLGIDVRGIVVEAIARSRRKAEARREEKANARALLREEKEKERLESAQRLEQMRLEDARRREQEKLLEAERREKERLEAKAAKRLGKKRTPLSLPASSGDEFFDETPTPIEEKTPAPKSGKEKKPFRFVDMDTVHEEEPKAPVSPVKEPKEEPRVSPVAPMEEEPAPVEERIPPIHIAPAAEADEDDGWRVRETEESDPTTEEDEPITLESLRKITETVELAPEEDGEEDSAPTFEYTPPATVGEDETFGIDELLPEEEADEIPLEREHVIRPVKEPVATSPVKEVVPAAPAQEKDDRITPDMIVTKTRITEADGVIPEDGEAVEEEAPVAKKQDFKFPPMDLLRSAGDAGQDDFDEEVNESSKRLKETLESFNVRTNVTGVSRGPRITRYELVPESGIRVRAIANLVDDITMSMASEGIRIEAPIPGKPAVGIEIPNKKPTTVYLRDMIATQAFRDAKTKTTVCLGADVTGEPVYADLAKMPHLLVAGATGMGKSVCINIIITSLLYKARPDEVKLILIDPKKVEFNMYAGIPHLLVPVVSDAQKAAAALNWAVKTMEERFDMIEQAGVRDIKGYNAGLADHPERQYMDSIVIIIDELNDLMLQARDTVETSICRIAQKARAAGIHLIIGTQRPSVDVITGVIKANIPSRIAFHVSQQVDSRTILDAVGAEKLLNNGDMLYYSVGFSRPKRVQGAFISDDEVASVVAFLRSQGGESYNEGVMAEIEREAERAAQSQKKGGGASAQESEGDDEEDPRFMEAVEIAVDSGKISTSLLQRKMGIGYGKAAKYIDRMQEKGIVSEPEGQKPRNVLITRMEFEEMRLKMSE